jgi:hypothetical protein
MLGYYDRLHADNFKWIIYWHRGFTGELVSYKAYRKEA